MSHFHIVFTYSLANCRIQQILRLRQVVLAFVILSPAMAFSFFVLRLAERNSGQITGCRAGSVVSIRLFDHDGILNSSLLTH